MADRDRSGVEVELPRRRQRHFMRVRLNLLLFLGYAGWSLVAALHGQRLLGALAVLVWLEFALATFRIGTQTGQVVQDPTTADRVIPILLPLCAAVGCQPPRLVLRDDRLRAAAVRRRKKSDLLILSRPFLQRVDDDELRAILAHEVVHLAHNDLRRARGRSIAALAGGAVLGGVSGGYSSGLIDIPIWTAAGLIGFLLTLALLSFRNRTLELRADAEGAALAGDPAAMARALAKAHTLSQETRAALYGSPPWRWLISPLSWRLPTHPSMARRIALLTQASVSTH